MATSVGPGRTLPSITGGGLSRAAAAIFEGKLAARELAQRDRQLNIQDSQHSLAQITALIPFLEEGTRLGDLDEATQIQFGRGFGVDPAEFQEVELNEQTLTSFIETLTLDRVKDLSPEEAARDEFLRALAGVEPIAAVSDLERGVADIQIEGLAEMIADPARKLEFQQRFQGLDPITITIPSTGVTIDFDRAAEAQLYVTMLGQETSADYAFDELTAERRDEAVKNIQDQLKERQFLIGAPAVVRLFGIYDQAIALEKEEGFGQGQLLLDQFQASGASEGEKLAMNLIAGAIPFGDQFLLGNLPSSLVRGAALADLIVRIEAADPDQLSGLLDQLPEAYGRIIREGPFSFLGFGQPIFNVPESEGGPAASVGTGAPPPPISPLTRDESIQATRENLSTMSREELVERMTEEIVVAAEALGEIEQGVIPPPVEPPEPTLTGEELTAAAARAGVHAPTQAADTAVVLSSEQRQLDRLIQLRQNSSNPEAIDQRIVFLRQEIAIQQATVPFGEEGKILVDSVPASVRAAATRYNSIQDLLNRATSGAGRRARVRALEPLLREIKTAIAEG